MLRKPLCWAILILYRFMLWWMRFTLVYLDGCGCAPFTISSMEKDLDALVIDTKYLQKDLKNV